MRARTRNNPVGVSDLIAKARAAAGFSQDQLARKIGTSQPMVARWESGSQMPSVRSLLRIAEATGFELALGIKLPGTAKGSFEFLEVLDVSDSKSLRSYSKEGSGG